MIRKNLVRKNLISRTLAPKTLVRNDLEFYDRNAADWWNPTAKIYALNYLNPARFAYFDRFFPNWQGQRVLDIGCGGGYTCEYLANRGAIVSGLDFSQACIDSARIHAADMNLSIDYRQGCAEALPYADASFDAVICVDVLEHVADVEKTIAEVNRVLKPGGMFGFDTINRTWKSKIIMIWLLEDILKEIPAGVHDWQKFIPPEHLEESLQSSHFEQIEIKGFNIFGSRLIDQVKAYWYYRQTQNFQISINDDRSVMYIGKANKRSTE